MKKEKQVAAGDTSTTQQSLKLGEYAYSIVREQYLKLVKQEKKVLADKDPEHLHQMRVATRRLRTALQVFGKAVELPKVANEKQLRSLARVLGQLRDLDVQTADLQNNYRSEISSKEQGLLDKAAKALQQQRRKAFANVEDVLKRSRYQDLKAAYEKWLDQPRYTDLAQLPLLSVLPDLLSPLLSTLLLHSGWLISVNHLTEENSIVLHELRKDFKHARYQAEFFTTFYGEDFKTWIDEVKDIQERLGMFQDTQVLQSLLQNELPTEKMPELHTIIQQTQADALSGWEEIQQKYLDPTFRYHLYQLILKPESPDDLVVKSQEPVGVELS